MYISYSIVKAGIRTFRRVGSYLVPTNLGIFTTENIYAKSTKFIVSFLSQHQRTNTMGILNWGFRTNVRVFQGKDTSSAVISKTENGDNVSFENFIKNGMPTLDTSKKLWLHPLLFNGTLQTLYYAKHDSSDKYLIYYGRELFTYKDGGISSLDWVIPEPQDKEQFAKQYQETLPEGWPKLHPRSRFFSESELAERKKADQDETKPLVVVLHGLGGGSHEPLIRNLAENIHKNSPGWDTVVINTRGCCRTKVTTGKLFTGLSTGDVHEPLVEFRKRYPKRDIYAVGFSFGAAMLANYLGLHDDALDDDNILKAACVIGCPWDFVDSNYHLNQSYTGTYLLNPSLLQFLCKIVTNNFGELNGAHPEIYNEESIKKCKKSGRTMVFDDYFTCRVAGFNNPWEYYRAVSPFNRIKNIRVPTLVINSNDDPAVGCRLPYMDIERNPNVALVETDLGGHLGWVKSNGDFWCVEVAEEFFHNFSKWTT